MSIEVVLLGTGCPLPDPNRAGPSTLVRAGGKALLFDAGRGVLIRAAAAGVPSPAWLAHLFLTHLHSDHITDFSNHDTIVFEASSGATSFAGLTLTKVGNSTVITWGTSDSLTVDGVKPNQMHASDFSFVTSAAVVATADVSRSTMGTDLHSASIVGAAFDHGVFHLAPDLI